MTHTYVSVVFDVYPTRVFLVSDSNLFIDARSTRTLRKDGTNTEHNGREDGRVDVKKSYWSFAASSAESNRLEIR